MSHQRLFTFHCVRLGVPRLDIAYRTDWAGRYWWLDLWRWRICLIQHDIDGHRGVGLRTTSAAELVATAAVSGRERDEAADVSKGQVRP